MRLVNGGRPEDRNFSAFRRRIRMDEADSFRPFDLKKWLVLGFAAFIAGNLGRLRRR